MFVAVKQPQQRDSARLMDEPGKTSIKTPCVRRANEISVIYASSSCSARRTSNSLALRGGLAPWVAGRHCYRGWTGRPAEWIACFDQFEIESALRVISE